MKIIEVVVGSHMWGTATKSSDYDIRVITMRPLDEILDPFAPMADRAKSHINEVRHGVVVDSVTYDLRHFARLAVKGNPTAMEILFSPTVESQTREGIRLRTMRQSMLDATNIYRAHHGFVANVLKNTYQKKGATQGKSLSAATMACLMGTSLLKSKYADPRTILDDSRETLSQEFHIRLKQGDECACELARRDLREVYLADMEMTYDTMETKFVADKEEIAELVYEMYQERYIRGSNSTLLYP